jgi:hypothetical protein
MRGFIRISIPNTYSKLLLERMRASEINHCLIIGSHGCAVVFAFTATSRIVATVKFISTYIIAWF